MLTPLLTLLICIGLGYYFFIQKKKANKGFWYVAAKHPEEALALFNKYDCWKVFKSQEEVAAAGLPEGWAGPFRLYIPSLKQIILIYGKNPECFRRYDEFERELEPQTSASRKPTLT